MVNYQLGKIYKIVDNTNGNIYIGSTCEPILSRRLAQHKSDYKKYLNGKHNFITSFEILKNENYEIILVENFPCNNKDELHAKERFYIENNECINKVVPNRTNKEWKKQNYQKNKQTVLEKNKQYREQNKDKLAEKAKEYREQKQENLKQYFKQH